MRPQQDSLDGLAELAQALAGLPDGELDVDELISAAQESAKQEEERLAQSLRSLGHRVVGLYYQRAGQRVELEQRWLADLRRYNAQYEPDQKAALAARRFGSRAFVPLTRRVVDIVEARLADLLFPAGSRTFGISPSPVPELAKAELLASGLAPGASIQLPDGTELGADAVTMAIREVREEAKSRADGMQRVVDDQLQESNIHKLGRRALHEGLVIGTGVVKGPVSTRRTRRAVIDGASVKREEVAAEARFVSTWNFFPDMSATDLSESHSDIERHFHQAAEFAALAQQPGFEFGADSIRRILKTPPGARRDQNLDEMRLAAGLSGVPDDRYMILEYHGPIERQELIDAGVDVPDDELMVYEGIVWVYEGDGTVLKAALEPLDPVERASDVRPYSVYCWRKDPASIFGFSLSGELSDAQDSANSTWRAAHDNAGLSVGGVLAVNSKVLRPEDGSWTITPKKVFVGTTSEADMRAAMHFEEIPSHINDLMALFDRSKQLFDDIGGPGMAMQGQDAPSYLDTARGASIAFNAANVWFRRGVAQWDDDITTPLVSRFVAWNLQYHEDESIKGGDWNVIARGRSALIEAEGQANRLQIFQQASAGVPVPFRYRMAHLKELARALRLDPADVLPDDAEIKQIAERMEKAPAPADPTMERLKLRQAELSENQTQRDHELQMATMKGQAQLADIASKQQITIEEARQRYGLEWAKMDAELKDRVAQRAHEAQMLNAELVTKARTGSGI